MTKMMIGLRASCQPRFNLENDAIDGIKQGIFTNDTDLKVFSDFNEKYFRKKFDSNSKFLGATNSAM